MALTIKKVKKLAMQNYEKGGDGIIECYDDKMIQELIDSGINTENKLLKWFKDGYEIDEEYRKAALWHGYGTTNEEELVANESVEETETEYCYEDEFDDPCFGCMARDNSYNCKHCKYGDDGRYGSPFDVYTISELF